MGLWERIKLLLFGRDRYVVHLETELARMQDEYRKLLNSVLLSKQIPSIEPIARPSESQPLKKKLLPSQLVRMNERITFKQAEERAANEKANAENSARGIDLTRGKAI